jgi:hypothetical protein
MSVYINHDVVNRQLAEIERAHRDLEHRADLRRRRAVQGLSAVGLLSSAAREAYRRDVVSALPYARFILNRDGSLSPDTRRLQTTMRPLPETVSGSVAETSSHAASIALSAVGGERRAEDSPWLSVASAGFLTIRAIAVGRQLVEEIEDGHLDVFTTLNAVTSIAAVPLALPEAMRAVRGLLKRDG